MQKKIDLHDLVTFHLFIIEYDETQGFIPPGSAGLAREVLSQFLDFLSKSKATINSLDSIRESELSAFYLELKSDSKNLSSVVGRLRIVVGFLQFVEECGYFPSTCSGSVFY